MHLIREKEGGKFFVRKVMKGQHPVYLTLQDCSHPCLPQIYDVAITEKESTGTQQPGILLSILFWLTGCIKINQAYMPALFINNIGWLNVTVNDALTIYKQG